MTVKQETLEFLRAQREAAVREDTHAHFQMWADALGDLVRSIETWVADAVAERLITTRTEHGTVVERFLGVKSVPTIHLLTGGGDEVRLIPISAFVLDADGRADLKGPRGTAKLVWERDRGWLSAEITPAGRWRRRPLSEEIFWEVFRDLLSPALGRPSGEAG